MRCLLIAILAAAITACESIPKDALMWTESSLADRELQTRTFSEVTENQILSASAAVIQDLGYTISESETRLGLISANKVADATSPGQIAGAILIGVLTGVTGPIDDEQHIRMSLVSYLSPISSAYNVRITLQRVIYDTGGTISRSETINNPAVYEEFFEKLSKAVFLETHS